MITQASNRPLVISLPFSVTDATEIHVELYNSVGTIKHWDEDDITVSTDGKALICPMTQADTAAMAAGRASCVVKALVDGVVMQTQKMPISIKSYHDHTIMGDDDPITEYDITYTGSLEEPQGILNPESIRTAIVIRAGTVPDDVAEAAVTAWMTAHASEIKGATGPAGRDGTNGQDAKINGVNTLTLAAGDNITLDQSGSTLTISSTGGGGGGSTAWSDITGKPSTFTPSAHSHAQSDINGLSTALAGKAASNHTHSYNDLTNKPTIPVAVTDDHIAEVAATVVPSDDITANTDARHTHSNKAFLDTVTGLKTVNGNSLIGSGDITIQGGGTSTDVQINGTSITENGVANIVANPGYGIGKSAVGLYVANPADEYITQRKANMAVTCIQLDKAVKAALTDGVGAAYTDTEQTAARNRLGVPDYSAESWELINSVTVDTASTGILFNKDMNENTFSLKKLRVVCSFVYDGTNNTSIVVKFASGNVTPNWNNGIRLGTGYTHGAGLAEGTVSYYILDAENLLHDTNDVLWVSTDMKSANETSVNNQVYTANASMGRHTLFPTANTTKSLTEQLAETATITGNAVTASNVWVGSYSACIAPGSEIRLYGVRENTTLGNLNGAITNLEEVV